MRRSYLAMRKKDAKKMTNRVIDFMADYASFLAGCGVHTARVMRNTKRIGEAWGYEVELSGFFRSLIITVRDPRTGEAYTRDAHIQAQPISFSQNANLSALSWQVVDEQLSLDEAIRRFQLLKQHRRLPLWLMTVLIAVAGAAFCRIFGGDGVAMLFVGLGTLGGYALRSFCRKKGLNEYVTVFGCALVASLVASVALLWSATPEVALATAPLFLVPGVPLINSIIDILDGHILTGIARLVSAAILICCLSLGLAVPIILFMHSLL